MKTTAMIVAAAFAAGAALPAGAADSPFGICEHLAMPASYTSTGEYTNRVALLNYCAAAGIGMVRTDFRWRLCWSAANSDWSWTYTDNVVADAERRGVEILPILMGDNPETGAKAYADLDDWAEFVRRSRSGTNGTTRTSGAEPSRSMHGCWSARRRRCAPSIRPSAS